MKREHIAQLAHEINRAYCLALGDDSQKAWGEAPDWQKESALLGVDLHQANPDAGPEASHESWMAQKVADGWSYGEVKDEAAKTHPCLVPFAELPVEQQAKDFLFRGLVHAVAGLPKGAYFTEEEVTQRIAAAVQAATASGKAAGATLGALNNLTGAMPPGMLPVKYVGKRAKYRDGTYGTGIEFLQGQTLPVPETIAQLMYRHPDVYEPGQSSEVSDAAPVIAAAATTDTDKPKQTGDTEESLQMARDSVNAMDKEALISYAKTNFAGHQISNKLGLEKMRAKVVGLIDQYGLS